tara:strand:+ start:2894 stop:3766 length:873 start_codon:yes stop_codon:yes gene_type:complete
LKKYLFLLPVYNDWKSLNLLLSKIDEVIGEKSNKADILVINDNSSEEIYFDTKLFKNFQNLKVVTLNKNVGSQRSIAIGLKYLLSEKKDYIITVLDSDGEDDPSKINEMIENAQKFKRFIIVSSRTNRKENFIFKTLYFIHKVFTFLFSAKWISFGNFSSFDSENLKEILKNNNVWLAYSSSIALNCNVKKLYAKRKQRYFGESKVNFASLVLHSMRVISVLYFRVMVFSIIYFFALLLIYLSYNNIYLIVLMFSLVILNISNLIIRKLINIENLGFWKNNIKDIKNINL